MVEDAEDQSPFCHIPSEKDSAFIDFLGLPYVVYLYVGYFSLPKLTY